ncbi:MAG: two-component regulator propeller domain-containing protein, partial [Panacibacter sp.]
KQGFIWIGAEDGLTRYDGYSSVVYRHQDGNSYSLSDNEIYALCTDNDGTLWIGTRNGLNRYDARNDRFDVFLHDNNNDNSLANNEVFALAKDHSGNLLVGTYGGGLDMLVKSESTTAQKKITYRFIHHRHDDKDSSSISNNQVFSVCVDRQERVWIGTYNGLNVMQPSDKKFTHFFHQQNNNSSITKNGVYKIFADSSNRIWICGNGMLDHISWQTNSGINNVKVRHFLPQIAAGENLNDWAINDFFIDHNGAAWMATNDHGLLKFTITPEVTINNIEHFTSNGQSSYSLPNAAVFNLYEDRSGVIWIGTAKGLCKYNRSKSRFNEVNIPDYVFPYKKHFITALLADKQNRLWLGFDSDTLTIINKNAADPLHKNEKIPLSFSSAFNQVNVLYQSNAGDIYIGTLLQGLYIIPYSLQNMYDKKQWLHISVESDKALPSNNIYAVTEDSNGIIWLGTYKGVCNYNPKTKQAQAVYVSPKQMVVSDYIIRTLCTDADNTIWCGSDNGLYLIKNNTVIKTFRNDETNAASISNNGITVVFPDRNKNIWIGTKAGLNLFNKTKNNFQRFTLQSGLPSDGIRSIQQDTDGHLWVGTNNGLVKFNTSDKKIAAYGIEDGLCSNQFGTNAADRDNEGSLYFGTNNGLVSFRPGNITPNLFVPPVAITNIRILNNPLATLSDTSIINTYRKENRLVLQYDQNFFSFEFAALNYINSSANKYAYQLEGVDKEWNNSGTQRFAGYTDIQPGNYTFKVKASNNDGVWNNIPVTVEVIIIPPWWRTWWFYTLCVIAFCALIYTIYRIRVKQILKLYNLRSSIAKDLHDDVGSALSSIALLSRIAHDGKTNARLNPDEIFSRIGDTSKRMIDLMDDIIWSVNPDNDRFSNMLIRMREYAAEMLEAKDIDFTFKVAEDIEELKIPMQMRKDYFLIFKEAINNLAKYSQCTQAAIRIYHTNRNIVTTIDDNGIGFDPQAINSRNGLKNMQQRAASIKGTFEIDTQPGQGTRITLTIPAA